ncbi:hypothetical protein WH43_00370 [Rheinheimera sp. KL1]|nr:hypothetical protein WH43_00370 [Rheinheimera sp. KL1]
MGVDALVMNLSGQAAADRLVRPLAECLDPGGELQCSPHPGVLGQATADRLVRPFAELKA